MLRRSSLLESPLFISSLALLAINDLFLKPIEINWLTGKLSDFAGLAALYITLIALWPRKAKTLAWAVVAGWITWKTPLSRPLLDLIELSIGISYLRVEDLTDLLALAILPLVYRYSLRYITRSAFRFEHGIGLLTALVIFAGSPPQDDRDALFRYKIDYHYDRSVFALLDAIKANARNVSVNSSTPGNYTISIEAPSPDSQINYVVIANIELSRSAEHTRLRLFEARQAGLWMEEQAVLPFIEQHLIARLPEYKSRHERMFYTDKRNAPGWPLLMLIIAVWPATLAWRRISDRRLGADGKRKFGSVILGSIYGVIAIYLVFTAIYYLIDALYIGGPYVEIR